MRFLLSTAFFILVASLSAQIPCTEAGDGSFTVNPPLPPAGATYPVGTVVEMCYTLDEYFNPSNNWLHSLVVDFGPGFDSNSVVPSNIPASCNGNGSWNWYNSWTSCYSGLTFGPGFAYDGTSGIGCGGGPNDGDPGNNWGDGLNDCTHVWCWRVNTVSTPNSCNVDLYTTRIRVYGDSETGSWNAGGNPPPCLTTDPICWPEIQNLVATQINAPCAPDPFQVEATFDGGDAACGFAIEWQDAAGNVVATGQNASLDAGTYTVVVSLSGCSEYTDPIVLDYGTSVPTLDPSPSAQFCFGETITLTATGGDAYFFYPPDGSGPLAGDFNGGTFTTTADESANGQWSVEVFNGNCTVDLLVIISVSPELSPMGSTNGPVCIGEPIRFTGFGAPPGGSYEWMVDGNQSFNNPYNYTTSSSGVQTATLTIYDASGNCSQDIDVPFEVFDLPSIDISATDLIACEGESITLFAIGGGTYAWNTGQTGSSISVSPSNTTTYTVTVTSPEGCEDEASITIDVQPLLAAPTINCDTPNPGQMTFSWNDVPGADFYRVFLDEGCTGNFVLLENNYTANSVQFTGLEPLTNNCIRVIAFSNNNVNCPGTTAEESCTTPDCNPVNIFVEDGDLGPFCFDPFSSDFITISAEVNAVDQGNFFWSSNDVTIFNDNNPATFSPPGPGNFILTATYVQPDGSCSYSEDFEVIIEEAAAADFNLSSSAVCANETVSVQLSNFDNPSATYNWNFGGATVLSGSGNSGPYVLSFPNPGTYTITLDTEVGNCTDSSSRTITVGTPIAAPTVFCQATSQNSITFAWNDVPGANGYTVNVLTGQTGSLMGNTYTLTGLALGETVQITVTAIGTAPCPASTSLAQTCQAQSCPDVTVSITTPPDTFCFDNQNAPLPLELTVNGAVNPTDTIWTGPGVTGNTFNPDLAGAGIHTVTATVTDDNCPFTANVQFVVLALPTATFDLAAEVCLDSLTSVTYTGSADPANSTFTWDFGGGNATPGTGPGPHSVRWPTTGIATVSLSVTEGNCTATLLSEDINVLNPLSPPVVNCINPGLDQVTFEWQVDPAAAGYQVVLVSGSAGIQNGNTYTVTGLNEGDEVTIDVIALNNGLCGNSAPTRISCQARSCPPITVNINQNPASFCADQSTAFVPLTASVSGSTVPGVFTWAGAATNDTFFVANGQVGTNEVIVFYTEDGCTYSDTTTFTILPTPSVGIDVDLANICLTQSAQISYNGPALPPTAIYNWDFDGGIAMPGTGPGPHTVNWTTPGNKLIQLSTTLEGCSSPPDSATILVTAPLPAPALSCGGGDIDSVSFAWPPIPGASGYVVEINGGMPQTITNTSIGVGGLVEGQMVMISVYAIGSAPCGDGPAANFVCTAAVCPEITLAIDESTSMFCLDEPDAFHLLSVAFNSGTGGGTYSWSGTNVSNDTFFYDQAGAGMHPVFLSYTEGSCTYADTATFTVFEVPTANFTLDIDTLCITGQATATYAGSATVGAQYDWDFGTATATPGTGPGPHQLTWDSPGEQTITLSVEENGCSSTPVAQTVTVADTLALPVLTCSNASLQTASVAWLPIAGASAYEITIDGSVQDTTTATTFTATALAPGQVVNFTVRPLGAAPCGDGSPVSITCQSLDCPVLLADFSANTNTFCLEPAIDQSINLSAIVSGGSGNNASFNWSGPGVVGSVFDPAIAGIGEHTILLNYQEFGPCDLVDSFLLNVFPLPNTDFTISSSRICLGDSIVLALAGAVPPNSSQVSWNLGGVLLDGQGPHSFTPSAVGTLDITVTISINGCTQTSSPQTLEIVAPLTAPVLSCANNTLESTTFAWEAVSSALGYIVLLEDGSRDTVNTLEYTLLGLSPSQVASIEVIAIGEAPCGDSPASAFSCSAMDCPNIQLSATANQQIFCLGLDTETIEINLSSSGGDMSGTFTINHPAVSFTNGLYFFDPTTAGVGQHIIEVDYVETAGCSAQTTIIMEVLPVPVADFTMSSTLVCEAENTTISYTGSATASWDFAGATVTSLGNETYQISFSQAGIYPIQLIVSAGNCSDTLAQNIEVVAPLAPPAPFCAASTLTSLTFAWPNVVGANGYRIQIDGGTALTLADTFYVVDNLTDEQNVLISVTAIGSPPCGDSETASASCTTLACTVYELQATASQQAFCTAAADLPTPLELLFLNTPQGDGNIQWFGEGVENQNGQFVFNPQGLAAGTYVLTAVYTESICTTQTTLEMIVTNTPNIRLQLSENSICEGASTLLTLDGDVDASLNFTFDFDEANVQDQGNNQYLLSWDTPGNYTISLLTDRNGCEQIATNTIAVAAQPTAGTVLGALTICAGSGEVLALSEQLLGADGGGIWSPGLGSPATIDAGSGQLITQNMAPGTYTYLYTIAGGVCETVANELTVTLLPAPRVDAGLNQTLTCAMGMVSLSGNGQSDGGGPISYEWTGPEGSFLTDSSSAMIDVSTPGIYTLRVTDEIGCSATDEVLVNAETEVPIPQIELSNISCFSANDGAILVSSVEGGRPPYRYALNNAAPTNTTFFTSLQAGEYNLRVSDANGCFSDLFLDISQPEQLRVSLSVNSDRTEYELGEEVTVTAQITGGNVIDTLLWEPDSLGFRGEGNSLTFLASETQQVRVTVVDEQGCRGSDQITILVRKDIPVYIPSGFSPNGDNVNDILFIGANNDRIRRIESFLVFNRWGEAVFQNYDFAPNDPAQGWDGNHRGETLNPAVFVYVAVVEMTDGEKIVFKGDITLVR